MDRFLESLENPIPSLLELLRNRHCVTLSLRIDTYSLGTPEEWLVKSSRNSMKLLMEPLRKQQSREWSVIVSTYSLKTSRDLFMQHLRKLWNYHGDPWESNVILEGISKDTNWIIKDNTRNSMESLRTSMHHRGINSVLYYLWGSIRTH